MTETLRNVDPDEIEKFERLAGRWWDPNSEFKPLHDINPLRLDYIDRLAPLAGKQVIDVGCGGGLLTEGMAQRGAIVTGIDMGKTPLSVARLHQHESGLDIDYRQTTAEHIASEQAGRYDIVPTARSPTSPRTIPPWCRRSTSPHSRSCGRCRWGRTPSASSWR